ncbi:YifB family Mg chelatase-like AAA ATPase [Azovibrio restrictus]|uniref:YifB family Mg chelatase-like AAA ATPase n=1 Tax=Azovibrio restrictus TaxID=146938 RepID=UPI0026F34D08|nr:YifB family Mg chelatase-like AAA ATPase [Azovibrio restrictus]
MTLASLWCRGLDGLQAPRVRVEVHLAAGLPGFTLVGLPDTEVKEARDRVRAAIINSGFEFPQRRITVNLAPADLPKESGRFDLPIALGILAASGQIPARRLENHEFAGELSLSGALQPVRGAFAMILAAGDTGCTFILPQASASEAAQAAAAPVLGATSLLEVCAYLRGETGLATPEAAPAEAGPEHPDLADVKGQAQARRVLEIAAAGGHSLLLYGPPGSGKSMLASRLPGLLPPLEDAAARESAAVLSLAGCFDPSRFRQRPYRAPHATASAVALVGGGSPPRPGEISLATQGVLFLDEFTEFDRKVLESLRDPLERGEIHIARAARHATFPARFQLVAAMNPCPCGWQGHPNGRCRCTPDQIRRYRSKISGPILDRMDLIVEVPALPPETLAQTGTGEASATVRQRVAAALSRQQQRQGVANARLGPAQADTHLRPEADALALLQQAAVRLDLSARSWHRVLKVARTIADLADSPSIRKIHLAEALQYRRPFSEPA